MSVRRGDREVVQRRQLRAARRRDRRAARPQRRGQEHAARRARRERWRPRRGRSSATDASRSRSRRPTWLGAACWPTSSSRWPGGAFRAPSGPGERARGAGGDAAPSTWPRDRRDAVRRRAPPRAPGARRWRWSPTSCCSTSRSPGSTPRSGRTLLEDALSALRSDARATLVVVHDRAEAWALADRLLILIDGRLVADGPPRELLEHPPSPSVARFLGYDGWLTDGARPC